MVHAIFDQVLDLLEDCTRADGSVERFVLREACEERLSAIFGAVPAAERTDAALTAAALADWLRREGRAESADRLLRVARASLSVDAGGLAERLAGARASNSRRRWTSMTAAAPRPAAASAGPSFRGALGLRLGTGR